MLAHLQHPNLPSIFDHFEENGRWYLVMSFIEGETLADYLSHTQDGKLALNEVVQIGIQLCTVLSYLHNQQPAIIFRDLKPSNIMHASDGHIYLIDFGIARHFKPGQAKDTAYYGSMGYAPPEQYGKAQTTPRSDIYSLGVVLYQLLSGYNPSVTPFRFPPLQSQVPSTPMEMVTLISGMLELDEDKRPTSMTAVSQKLQSLATPHRATLPQPTVVAGIPPVSPHAQVQSQKSWIYITIAIGVVFLVVYVLLRITSTPPSISTSNVDFSTPTSTSTSSIGIAPGGTAPSTFIVKPGMTWRGSLRTCGDPSTCGAQLKILIIDAAGNFTGTWANDYSSANGTNYTDVENVQGNITGNHISWTGTGRIQGNLIIPDAHHEGNINSNGHIHGDSPNDSFDLDSV